MSGLDASVEPSGQAAPEGLGQMSARPSRPDVLSFDEFHRKCRDVFPIVFEGAKVMLNKQLSSHFQISHSINLSTNLNGYRFGSTYVGSKPVGGPGELFPVMLGDMDPQGNTSATVLHQFSNGIRFKGMAQVQQSKMAGTQFSLERRGRLTTSALTVANPNILNNSGAFIGSYVRRLTENLELGAELITQCASQKPGQTDVMSVLSYGMRYCTLVGPQLQLLPIVDSTPLTTTNSRTVCSLVLTSSLASGSRRARLASCDTDWTVSSVMEKKLSKQLPFTFVLSLIHNFSKPVTKVGAGLMIGG